MSRPMASSVPSPCISICKMDSRSGWCEGCLRTLDEIAGWSVMDDEQKRRVWKLLPQRRETLAVIKGAMKGGAA